MSHVYSLYLNNFEQVLLHRASLVTLIDLFKQVTVLFKLLNVS